MGAAAKKTPMNNNRRESGMDRVWAEGLAASYRNRRDIDRQERWQNIKYTSLFAGIAVLLFWILPRVYKQQYWEMDALDAQRVLHYERHWLGRTEVTIYEARFDRAAGRWFWEIRAKTKL